METTPEPSRTPCNTTMKRLNRANRFRKALNSLPNNTWPSEMLPHQIRQTSSDYARDFSSDHNIKSPEIKSSEDSIVAGLDINEINYPNYGTALRKSREKTSRDLNYKVGVKNANDDPPVHVLDQRKESVIDEYRVGGVNCIPETMIAEEKLKKLKELQRKREFIERYYSSEIRKLICDYYRSSCNSGDSKNKDEKRILMPEGSGQQQICAVSKEGMISPRDNSNLLKTLEPCGTMTTITRLDCGCMQETTRPIFTTSQGRVENRNCHYGKNSAFLELTSSNPQEHLSSSNFTENRKIALHKSLGMKHRSGMESRILQARTAFCDIHSKRIHGTNLRTNSAINNKTGSHRPGTASSSFIKDNPKSRNLSPLRKYSDTSTD